MTSKNGCCISSSLWSSESSKVLGKRDITSLHADKKVSMERIKIDAAVERTAGGCSQV